MECFLDCISKIILCLNGNLLQVSDCLNSIFAQVRQRQIVLEELVKVILAQAIHQGSGIFGRGINFEKSWLLALILEKQTIMDGEHVDHASPFLLTSWWFTCHLICTREISNRLLGLRSHRAVVSQIYKNSRPVGKVLCMRTWVMAKSALC